MRSHDILRAFCNTITIYCSSHLPRVKAVVIPNIIQALKKYLLFKYENQHEF